MKDFIVALQFMTRFAVGTHLQVTPKDMVTSTRMYPLVGLVIGLLLAGLYVLLHQVLQLSGLVTAALVVVGEVFMTGGLHLDGLMDSADGLLSWRPKEKILEIMKDSRVGANGAIALVSVLLVKVSLVHSLAQAHIWLLVAVPVIARWMILYCAATHTHPNPQSTLGRGIIGQIPPRSLRFGTVVCGLVLTVVGVAVWPLHAPWAPILLVLWGVGWLTAWRLADSAARRIDGITGDILGAILEVGEVVLLLAGVMLLGWSG